ncbi:MAG: Hsp70 family protein [Saccharospirillaceae bacterium]|nr:Hsp70 family protein [Saccharospirillaceae bacterium]
MSDSIIAGIDLGTTYTAFAVIKNGKPQIVANRNGERTTASIVSYHDNEIVVGSAAKKSKRLYPLETVAESKRLIGLKGREAEEILKSKTSIDIKNIELLGDDKVPHYHIQNENFTPTEVAAAILTVVKRDVAVQLGEKAIKAVITVPAYFSDAQRTQTKIAAEAASIEVLEIMNEPTAAAVAYVHESEAAQKLFLVFDMGGGTLDVSLVANQGDQLVIKATSGDSYLGGEEVNDILVKSLLKRIKRENITPRQHEKLRQEMEQVKRHLSQKKRDKIIIEDFADGLDLVEEITREEMNVACNSFFKRALAHVDEVLETAKVNSASIDRVIMAGGSSRIVRLNELLAATFGEQKICREINPDEAIAMGAALRAAQLTGLLTLPQIQDIVPKALGILTADGNISHILNKGDPLPAAHHRKYTTVEDWQSVVKIEVYEGDGDLPEICELLGVFDLNIPPQLKQDVVLKVKFTINNSGMLEVSASNPSAKGSTQRVVKININRHGLTSAQIKEIGSSIQNKLPPPENDDLLQILSDDEILLMDS